METRASPGWRTTAAIATKRKSPYQVLTPLSENAKKTRGSANGTKSRGRTSSLRNSDEHGGRQKTAPLQLSGGGIKKRSIPFLELMKAASPQVFSEYQKGAAAHSNRNNLSLIHI